jgi:hypothetical protein
MKKTILAFFILFGFGIFYIAFAQLDIHISQVQITGGKNNTGNDFIEFFNASSSPVNLKGCRLVKRPGNANSDTLVKTWSKDTNIAAKSFYLWANSGFVTIAAKPDVVSSATISDNTGVALRFGAVNIGEIVDAISWGKTDNGFNNVSAQNPGANLSLTRKDLYQPSSDYIIAAATPHNSTMNDLVAAFHASQETDRVISNNDNNNDQTAANKNPPVTAAASSSIVLAPNAGLVEGDMIAATSSANDQSPEPAYPTQSYPSQSAKQGAVKYLILSCAALIALLFIAKKYLFTKPKG